MYHANPQNPCNLISKAPNPKVEHMIPVKMDDGRTVIKSSQEWSKITEKRAGEITRAFTTETRDRENGLAPRNMQGIVGLKPLKRRKTRPSSRLKKNPKQCALANRFLMGRI